MELWVKEFKHICSYFDNNKVPLWDCSSHFFSFFVRGLVRIFYYCSVFPYPIFRNLYYMKCSKSPQYNDTKYTPISVQIRKKIYLNGGKQDTKVFVSQPQIFRHFHGFFWPNSTHFFFLLYVMNDEPYERINEQKLYSLPGIFSNVRRIFLCLCSQISLFLHEIWHKSRKG